MVHYLVEVEILEDAAQKAFFKSKPKFKATFYGKPEIFAVGKSFDDAVNQIELKVCQYFDKLSDLGENLPLPPDFSVAALESKAKNVIFHILDIDTSRYEEKTEKINVTLPIRLTRKIDEFIREKVYNSNLFSSRSDFIAKSSRHYLNYAENLNSIFSDEELNAIRYKESNTTENCRNLISYLNLNFCDEVILFATHKSVDATFSQNDGPETNLPLLGAVARVKFPGLGEQFILFDGLFLTAQRKPRYNEVQQVLDLAVQTKKTSFIQLSVPFTSQLLPVEAIRLLNRFPKQVLNAQTRPIFFSLLSEITEEQYNSI